MKSKLLFIITAFCLCIGCAQSNCETPGDSYAVDLLREARAYFESLPATRSGSVADETYNTLNPDGVEPQWLSGNVLHCKDIDQVETAVNLGRQYYLVVISDGKRAFLPVFPRLSVLIEPTTGNKLAYLSFYMPVVINTTAPGPMKEFGADAAAGRPFEGRVFYTSLSGFPFAIADMYDGKVTDYACLGDSRFSFEENWDNMYRMGGDWCVAYTETSDTRGVLDVNPVEDVVIIGIKPDHALKKFLDESIALWERQFFTLDEDRPGGGSGGGGSSTPPGEVITPKKSPNPNIETDDETVIELLDSLMQDCIGKKVIESVDRKITIVDTLGSSSKYYRHTRGNTVIEERITFGIDGGAITLLEELIHAYQCRDMFTACNYMLNLEIEAKIGWAIYMRKNGLSLHSRKKRFVKEDGIKILLSICSAYENKHILLSESDDLLFKDMYYNFRDVLMESKRYGNSKNYPFSDKHVNLENLVELMSDC